MKLRWAPRVAVVCAVLPGLVAVVILMAWFARPSQDLLDFTIFRYALPTLVLWALGVLLAGAFVILGWRTLGSHLRVAAPALAALSVDVLLGVALLFFMGRHISVSEVIVVNRSSVELRNVVVTAPGDRIELGALAAGASVDLPILPNNEGTLALRGADAEGRVWQARTFILECCPSEFRFELAESGSVDVSSRDLR